MTIMWDLQIVIVLCVGLGLAAAQDPTGPICHSCDRTDNPDQCRNAVTCGPEQACSVQQVSAPHGDVYFWSGCEDYEICDSLSESAIETTIIGRRRQASVKDSLCLYCCSTDLCNRNCTSFVNLALHRPAYESTVYPGVFGEAGLAVDGDATKDYYNGSCMHTAGTDQYPWWAVDLEGDFHITKVKLHERDDAGGDGRSIHLKVLVSSYNATKLDRDSDLFTQCGYYYGHSSDGNTVTIDCPKNTTGRWVRVQQSDPHNEYLHLCEVEVFGF